MFQPLMAGRSGNGSGVDEWMDVTCIYRLNSLQFNVLQIYRFYNRLDIWLFSKVETVLKV